MKVPSNILDEDSLDILNSIENKDLDFNEDILLNTNLDNFSLDVNEIY